MYEELLRNKVLNRGRLVPFGFEPRGGHYELSVPIMDGQFELSVRVLPGGEISTSVCERGGEEYILYRTCARTAFAREVRCAVERTLVQIIGSCYDTEVFRSAQARMLSEYVRGAYQDELEFLWERFPENAVWRRRDSRKWYGVMMTVPGSKLGLDSAETVEILDLRIEPDAMQALLQNSAYHAGYHMNKRRWFTVILDGSVPDAELRGRIDESYALAAG